MTPARRMAARGAIAAAWLVVIAALLGLGVWQVQRLGWKRALIAQVEARLRAPPVPPPETAAPGDAYRRIYAVGRFLPARDSFVQASTVRGPGWWVLTPLGLADGRVLFVNRGFVARRAVPQRPAGDLRVTGLLRLSEPKGGFLRNNDPAADRWFSRDIVAIAARRGVPAALPYFMDADGRIEQRADAPVGGLTVVRFPNSHLAYAITWFILAGMAIAGFCYWIRFLACGRREAT